MSTHDDLAYDARVIEAATVGPWKDAERYGAVIADAVPWMVDETERREYGGAVICESAHPHDRTFIVRARIRYPELVAEVRELRSEIEMLRRHLERAGWKPLRDGDWMTLQKIEGGKAP